MFKQSEEMTREVQRLRKLNTLIFSMLAYIEGYTDAAKMHELNDKLKSFLEQLNDRP